MSNNWYLVGGKLLPFTALDSEDVVCVQTVKPSEAN